MFCGGGKRCRFYITIPVLNCSQFYAEFFRRVRKIEKCDYQLHHVCLSVWPSIRPSVRMEQLGSYWKNSNEISYLSIFRKICLENSSFINPLNAELNPICYLLALLAYHFLHVSRIRVKIWFEKRVLYMKTNRHF